MVEYPQNEINNLPIELLTKILKLTDNLILNENVCKHWKEIMNEIYNDNNFISEKEVSYKKELDYYLFNFNKTIKYYTNFKKKTNHSYNIQILEFITNNECISNSENNDIPLAKNLPEIADFIDKVKASREDNILFRLDCNVKTFNNNNFIPLIEYSKSINPNIINYINTNIDNDKISQGKYWKVLLSGNLNFQINSQNNQNDQDNQNAQNIILKNNSEDNSSYPQNNATPPNITINNNSVLHLDIRSPNFILYETYLGLQYDYIFIECKDLIKTYIDSKKSLHTIKTTNNNYINLHITQKKN